MLSTWTNVASMPTARDFLAGARGSDGRIYAIGGSTDNGMTATNIVEAYNPSTDQWAPPPPVSHLLIPRQGLAAVEANDRRIYALGGSSMQEIICEDCSTFDGSSIENSVEAYSPITNMWVTVPPMNAHRFELAAALGSDSRIYAIGGRDQFGTVLNSVEAFKPSTNGPWTPLAGPGSVAPLTIHGVPQPRQGAAAAASLDGTIYVLGGTDGTTVQKTAFAFNPTLNLWTQLPDMTTPRQLLAAVRGPFGRLYVIGGTNESGPVGSFQSFDPSTNSWSAEFPMIPGPAPQVSSGRFALAAVLGLDSRIYAFGGEDSAGNDLSTNQALQGLGSRGAATTVKTPNEIPGDPMASLSSTFRITVTPLQTPADSGMFTGSAASDTLAAHDRRDLVVATSSDSLSTDLADAVFAGGIG